MGRKDDITYFFHVHISENSDTLLRNWRAVRIYCRNHFPIPSSFQARQRLTPKVCKQTNTPVLASSEYPQSPVPKRKDVSANRNSRTSIAMASLDHERILHQQRGRWKSLHTSMHTSNILPLAANDFKENWLPSEQKQQDETARSSGSCPMKPSTHKNGHTRSSWLPVPRNATPTREPLREQDVFFSPKVNSALPLDLSNDATGEQEDAGSSSYYMFPLNTPEQPRLDFYEPTDPFADAILFDEQYAFRRRRIIRNANKTTIAFHLPTGSLDIQGHQGV